MKKELDAVNTDREQSSEQFRDYVEECNTQIANLNSQVKKKIYNIKYINHLFSIYNFDDYIHMNMAQCRNINNRPNVIETLELHS